jgi:hypothetical protein
MVKLENLRGGEEMQLMSLGQILDEVVSKLERAIKNCEEFAHKNCHECNFGVKWDSMVVPIKDELLVSFMRLAGR